MQVDKGSDVTLMLKNFRQEMVKSKLRKGNLQLKKCEESGQGLSKQKNASK